GVPAPGRGRRAAAAGRGRPRARPRAHRRAGGAAAPRRFPGPPPAGLPRRVETHRARRRRRKNRPARCGQTDPRRLPQRRRARAQATTHLMNPTLESFHTTLRSAREEVGKVIIGQEAVIELALVTPLRRAHALMEGRPGGGKTLRVRTLGDVPSARSRRVQFAPALMPADLTGTSVRNLQCNAFTLFKGPVFTAF